MRDRAAQLSVPGSVLAGPAAARSWDLPVRDGRTFLVVPPHTGRAIRGAGLLYETLERRDVRVRDGVVVTSLPRTVVDCLRLLPERDALDLLERALQARWIGMDDLTERVRAHAGRRGAPRLVRLVARVAAGSRSAGERLMVRLLREADITGWAVNARIVDGGRLLGIGDVVFERAKLVIELDGWAFHSAPDRFQGDRVRQNGLVKARWNVLRFTWHDLTERPGYVIDTITATLAGADAA